MTPTPPPPEYEKFKDSAVLAREEEAGIGRVRMALFVAALGPIAILLNHTLQLTASRNLRLGMILTAPAALVLLAINYARLPGRLRGSKAALAVLVMTLVCIAATLVLWQHFGLLKG